MPVIDNCDSLEKWGFYPETCVISISTDCVEGIGSVRLDIPSAVVYWGYLFIDRYGEDWSKYPLLSFWVKVSALRAPIGQVSVGLTVWHGAAWSESMYDLSNALRGREGQWVHFMIDLRQPPDVGPSVDLTKIMRIRFDFYHPGGTDDYIQVDNVETSIPEPRKISGVVRDSKTGTPIMNVEVTADGYGPVYTPADGSFSLDVSAGIYTVRFKRAGYQTLERQVDVTAGDVTDLNILLVAVSAATIQGTVFDASTKNPVAGANVSLDGYTAVTDASGFYKFATVEPKAYTLTVSASGYKTATLTVDATSGGVITQDVALQPITPTPAPTVPTVTGPLGLWSFPLLTLIRELIKRLLGRQ